jgi:hypothetical protein
LPDKPALGFVALKSITQGPPDPEAALAEIRTIYFNTTKKTIDHDLAHAIELLKSLPSEDDRERATVFMQGLSEMQREWQAANRKSDRGPGGRKSKRTPSAATNHGGTETRRKK